MVPAVIPENPQRRQFLTLSLHGLTLDEQMCAPAECSGRSRMIPLVSALLALVASRFRSWAALRLEHLVRRHQLAVDKQTIHRPRRRPTDRLWWAWLAHLWRGWQDM